jgi:large subunit ribosomal protein L30
MAYIVIRVRGSINVRTKINDTLKMLRLNKINHCVIIPESNEYKGMLKKAKDYITWGEVNEDVLKELLTSRAKLEGNHPVNDKYVKSNSKYKSLKDFSAEIVKGKAKLTDLKEIKGVLRLHPPRKGYEGIKRPFSLGGALGYRGNKINDLIRRMI